MNTISLGYKLLLITELYDLNLYSYYGSVVETLILYITSSATANIYIFKYDLSARTQSSKDLLTNERCGRIKLKPGSIFRIRCVQIRHQMALCWQCQEIMGTDRAALLPIIF